MTLSPDQIDETLKTLRSMLEGASGDVVVDIERAPPEFLFEDRFGFRHHGCNDDWTVTIRHSGKHLVNIWDASTPIIPRVVDALV